MPLKKLSIYNARNIRELTLKFNPAFNLIHGQNGVGKTTILESIYLLLRARTFRSNNFRNFISFKADDCIIYSEFTTEDATNDFSLAIKRDKTTPTPIVHLNKNKITTLSTISRLVVLGLITPDSFNLLDSGPSIRRKYLDWGVFHVEHLFLKTWKDYKHVLNNRNILLKKIKKNSHLHQPTTNLENEITIWDGQLNKLNTKIDNYRRQHIQRIRPVFYEILKFFFGEMSKEIVLNYFQGWSRDITFEDMINKNRLEDIKSGFTNYGSHRSDIKITIKGKPAKEVLSRGQKKLMVIALILSQFIYLKTKIHKDSELLNQHFLLLLDDLDSELDEMNLKRFIDYLEQFHGIQYFISTTNINRFDFIEPIKKKVFHVKH